MANSLRVSVIRLLAFAALLFPLVARAQTRPPDVEQLAKAYGLDSWGQIDAVRYTFNLELPALKVKLSRTWTWEPKTGQVTYESTDKDGKPVKVTYNRNQLSSAPDNVKNDIEPGFVNDNYWFIFPFHAYWDTSANVTVKESQKLPIGNGSAKLVSVKYPAEVGGYTPGDTWDLYVGKDGRVVQFIYHRGGPKKPSNVTTTWAGYKMAGPLPVATEHRGTADGSPFHLVFANVAYKLAGSDAWVDAK
jgi:hypothetical protein